MKNRSYKAIIAFFIIAFILPLSITGAQQNNTSIFWEITGKGIDKPSYLYGSIQMISQDDFFLQDSLEDIFRSCKRIVLEIDMDAPDLIQRTQQLMVMPDKSIRDLISDNEYSLLEQFFKDSLNLQLAQFQKLKPFFLTQFIIPKIINKPLASYEMAFVQMAQKYTIELTGIESIEEQMNSLDKIPFDKQAALVIVTIKEFNEGRAIFHALIESYKKKDFVEFYKLMFQASRELEEFEQLLLIDRNIKWIPCIEKMIKEQSCFIAVGALHLEGQKGLVALLKSKGYKVRPV